MADLNRFKERIREYRLLVGRTQSELSLYLNLDYTELSNRLNGKKRARLSHENVRAIVRALAEWGSIATQAQARELMDIMECPYFEPVDWSARPLNRLKVEPVQTLPPPLPVPPTILQNEPRPSTRSHAGPLPVPLSTFVGREQELLQLAKLFNQPEVRLLTLTGAGGIGKTRLALQVANKLRTSFEDGIYFIDLAPLSDPESVPVALAKVSSLQEVGRQNLDQALRTYFADKSCLLIFDNFEQVMEAADLLNPLLAEAPHLKIMVTSREALHLYGEHEFGVAPLKVPDLLKLSSIENGELTDAVLLFMERARAANPRFQLNPDNTMVVAEICVRLEGWPLALELAATYLKLLSPQSLLQHLQGAYGETSLDLLKSKTRDRPERQQTIYRVLDWSYNLLSEEEKELFDRLGVFTGNYSFEVVRAVCASGTPSDLLEILGRLLGKSLIYRTNNSNDETRYFMLEPVQRYAQERLVTRGEEHEMHRRHASYYITLAEHAEAELRGVHQLVWLERLKQEHFNLQAALNWMLGKADTESVYTLTGSLGGFWENSGYLTEGRRMLDAALALNFDTSISNSPKPLKAKRAKTLGWAATLAFRQGDYASSIKFTQEGLALFRASEDRWGEAWILRLSGILSRHQGENAKAHQLFEQSLKIFETLDDEWGIAWALSGLGSLFQVQGNYTTSRELYGKSLTLFRQVGDKRNVAYLLNSLGEVARSSGDYPRAEQLYTESLEINREIDYRAAIVIILHNLGYIELHQNNPEKAGQIFRQCLELNNELGRKRGMAACMVGLAGVATANHRPERAARLLGAAEALRISINTRFDGADLTEYEAIVIETARLLSKTDYQTTWEQGGRQDLKKSLIFALE